jgi:hypothetical protein
MRENRTYGSEGGEAGEPAFPTPITGVLMRMNRMPSRRSALPGNTRYASSARGTQKREAAGAASLYAVSF